MTIEIAVEEQDGIFRWRVYYCETDRSAVVESVWRYRGKQSAVLAAQRFAALICSEFKPHVTT